VVAGLLPRVGARGVKSWPSSFLGRRKSTTLTASPEFERVYRNGSVYRGRLFSVHALPNATGEPRLGLSVSKKVGTAVKRNKVRRRLKEAFRFSAQRLPDNLDVVISARPAAAEASFEELNEEFLRSVRRFFRSAEARAADGGF
jgi:ribonuclease P protein component